MAPGVRTRLVQHCQEMSRDAEGPSHLKGLWNGAEPAEGLEPGDSTEQFGLGTRIRERASRGATVEAGLLLTAVSVSGCPGVGVCLQREWPVGSQQLDQVRQIRQVGLGPLVRLVI